jgi:hypothetical protein
MSDPTGKLDVAAWTPNRKTFIDLDYNNAPVIVEPAFADYREKNLIRPERDYTTGVQQLASGYWCLIPNNDDFTNFTKDVSMGIGEFADYNAASVLSEYARWHAPTELTDATSGASANLLSTGDYWIRKRVGSSQSWNQALIAGTGTQIPISDPLLPMDRVLNGQVAYAPEVGFLIRWEMWGVQPKHADNLFTFYFGGAVDAEGHGHYALQVRGNGQAVLWEDSLTLGWLVRDSWQYCDQVLANVGEHSMRITPHVARHLEFKSSATSRFQPLGLASSPPRVSRDTHLFTIRPDHRVGTYDLFATGSGTLAMDMRRDLRLDFQITRLVYPTSADLTGATYGGRLRDGGVHIGSRLAASRVVECRAHGANQPSTTAPGTTATAVVVAAYDVNVPGTPLVATTESYTSHVDGSARTRSGYAPPTGDVTLAFEFKLATTDDYRTPFFFGYSLERNGGTRAANPRPQTVSAMTQIKEVSIMGADADPNHNTAKVALIDRTALLTRLSERGDVPIRIRTQFRRNDAANTVNLFEGFSTRAVGRLRGTPHMPLGAGTTGAFRQHKNYELTCQGMWMRLYDIRMERLKWFNDCATDPIEAFPVPDPFHRGVNAPWRFTSMIRWLLGYAGFAPDQMDIPNLQLRAWWSGSKDDPEALHVLPYVSVGEYIQWLCSMFLGMYLVWDTNAGYRGMWRLRRFPLSNDPIKWHFVTKPCGNTKLSQRLESYPANTSPMLDGSYHTWIIPPEANHLRVVGLKEATGNLFQIEHQDETLVDRTIINDRSYDVPGSAIIPDPSDPDYLGRRRDVVYYDPLLLNQQMVDFVSWRVADILFTGYEMASFTGHLVLLDPGEPAIYQKQKRMLLFGDLVTINSVLYMVRGVSPSYRRDRMQLCSYECQLWRPPIWQRILAG